MMGSEAVRMLLAAEPGRYLLLGCALTMIALDVVWTRETFEKRPLRSGPCAAFAAGLPQFETSAGRHARGALTVGCRSDACPPPLVRGARP